jgi:AAA domain
MDQSPSKFVRFMKGNACPICGGADQDARGSGERCFGFRSGKWIHCSREEFAGRAKFNERSQTYGHVATGPCPCGQEHAPADPMASARKTIAHVYKYRDKEGKVVHETVRYAPKGFSQRRPVGNGEYKWSLRGIDRVLYNLPELIVADPRAVVWVCEGEKDADRLGTLGLLATTCAEGAGKWRDHYAETLRGRSVAILPDSDDPGHKHGQRVAQSLFGKAASVKVLELPDLPEKGDVSDFLDAGGTVERLRELLGRTAEWTAETAGVGLNPESDGDARKIWLPEGGVNYDVLTEEELNIRVASSITKKATTWIWKYRLSAGEMALIAGEGGLGKSQLILWICSAISRGWEWPDKSGSAPIGSVVIVSAEDKAETTIVPRLEAMGADLSKIFITSAPRVMIQERDKQKVVKLEWLTSFGYWRSVFDRHSDAKLFVVDPVASFLGPGVSVQKEEEIRTVIDPFNEGVIGPRGICFLANTHLNKNVEVKNIKHRINGASAWSNIPRNVHVVIRDEDDPKLRFFGQVKCNNAPDDLASFKFKIERREVAAEGGVIETSIPVFEKDLVEVNLNNVAEGGKHRGPQPQVSSKMARWLFEQLKDSPPVMLRDLIDDAREAGLLVLPTASVPRPSLSPLYNGKNRIPRMYPGWEVEQVGTEGKRAWKLFRIDESDERDTHGSSDSQAGSTPF